MKTKVDHVTAENTQIKKSVTDMQADIDHKIKDLDNLMRSLLRGEFDEVDEKMKRVENEVGLVQ